MELGYLISPIVQIVDNNGKPVVGAKIYVYNADTTVLVNTYNDFEFHLNPNPVLTDTLGNCTIIADNSKAYDIIVNDNEGLPLFSKKNITISSGIDPASNIVFEEGYGISINREGNVVTISVDTDLIATQDDLAAKQDKLYAGDNINIDAENKINVTGRKIVRVVSPLEMEISDDKVILSIDTDAISGNLSAGTDLKIENNIVSVNTNGQIKGGVYNFIAGENTWVSGNHNIIAGANISATGGRNAVFGGNNNVSGYSNSIGGYTNNISGAGVSVGGLNNTVSGQTDAVFGYNNEVSGDYTFVAGRLHDVSGESNTIVGEYNRCNGKDDFIGGSYTSAENLKESFVYGYKNNVKSSRTGNAIVNAIGENNNISGDNVQVLGSDNNITGTSNYILGSHNEINSYNGTQGCGIVGDYNTIGYTNSYTVGNRLTANDNEILIGLGPSATDLSFSGTYLKITPNGIYKVVNGVQTQL